MEKTINFEEVKKTIFEKLQICRSFATKELDEDAIYDRINSTKLPNDARIILLQLDYLQRVDKSLEDIRSRETERMLFDYEEEILEQLQLLEEIIVKFASRKLRVLGELHTKAIEDIILKVEIFGNCYAYSTALEDKYTGPTRDLVKQFLRDFEKSQITEKAEEIKDKIKKDQDRVNAALETDQKRAKAFEPITRQEISQLADVLQQATGLRQGHWYQCPNGHPYFVANCGGVVTEGNCACGARIGGQNYQPAAGNVRLQGNNQL